MMNISLSLAIHETEVYHISIIDQKAYQQQVVLYDRVGENGVTSLVNEVDIGAVPQKDINKSQILQLPSGEMQKACLFLPETKELSAVYVCRTFGKKQKPLI